MDSRVKDEEYLLHAMGFETANVHLGGAGARRAITRHLADYPKGELRKATLAMTESVDRDCKNWRRR